MLSVTQTKAQDLIRKTKGKVFTALFTKTDGTKRKMNCRIGVSKHVNGNGLAYNPADHNLITVFDMHVKDYRTLSLDRLIALQINGKFYVVE